MHRNERHCGFLKQGLPWPWPLMGSHCLVLEVSFLFVQFLGAHRYPAPQSMSTQHSEQRLAVSWQQRLTLVKLPGWHSVEAEQVSPAFFSAATFGAVFDSHNWDIRAMKAMQETTLILGDLNWKKELVEWQLMQWGYYVLLDEPVHRKYYILHASDFLATNFSSSIFFTVRTHRLSIKITYHSKVARG